MLSEQANAPLWAARAARDLAQAYMWYDPDRTLRLIPRARELSESVGELNGLAQCDMAVAMVHAMSGDWDRARPLLLAGMPIAEVAVETGFHDQSHLTRHFRALLGTTPGASRSVA